MVRVAKGGPDGAALLPSPAQVFAKARRRRRTDDGPAPCSSLRDRPAADERGVERAVVARLPGDDLRAPFGQGIGRREDGCDRYRGGESGRHEKSFNMRFG